MPSDPALLSPECLPALDALGGSEAVAGVHVLNRASHVESLLDTVEAGLGKLTTPRRVAVLVADGGSRDGTADIVRAWCSAKPRGPARCLIELVPPMQPGRALLALLAAALRIGARGIAVLDADLAAIPADWIPALIEPVQGGAADYVAPAYSRAASEGTLTTNLLAPLTRALYGKRIQQVTGGCSALAVPFIERSLPGWIDAGTPHVPGIEILLTVAALSSGARVVEVHLGRRPVDPTAAPLELATTLVRTVGPVYALMERYHDVWEQTHGSVVVPLLGDARVVSPSPPPPSVERMVRAFELGLKDLLPVWEQILANATLDQIYPLALLEPEEFSFPPALWARVVSDFAVAYHERQLPRDHLIRALTPLYLGRVAAFLREAGGSAPAGLADIIDRIGQAFEVEKDYLAARWR
jgi:glycosyltransferase involved in cell wall biosynthesis